MRLRIARRSILVVALFGWTLAVPVRVAAQSEHAVPVVYVAEVDSIIHPVSSQYMIDALDAADRDEAALVVFLLRTPGGLLDATRDIIARMIAAKTPVAVFVAPSGSRAASAGFLLTIAADIAAMAPGTHIGAAHPVSGGGETMPEAVARKAEEDVAAYARTLATARRRNADLAVEAVRTSRAFTDTEARDATPPLIDLVVNDLPALLTQLDGRTVRRFTGDTVVVKTSGARIERVAMNQRQRILSKLADPNLAYILLSLGMLGLTIELWSPGAILPGVVGGVSLLLAFFALQLLPVSYAGLLLVLLGLLLLALEIKVTSYGLLTLGGLVSLVLGSMMLIDSDHPELQISLGLILAMALGFGGIGLLLARLALSAQRQPSTTGGAPLVGAAATMETPVSPGTMGTVSLRGEIWRATADEPIPAGCRVRITNVDGLTLRVHKE